ncbi:hypothetical protein K431DRAFT_304897 [Polychaeton citri CBS 116435]|uniref:Yeast cell wall synthesis Kre9/Knh1 C-terminal domain-containing protein n=1 Tax=Polychaeton citri CBS 116435 TaxID=1314669 RepID=A0A9P4Q842_9PEZI|nr:hypothetical protein K431DRAFT_304897 [Polychaeton citri CBS 116435]
MKFYTATAFAAVLLQGTFATLEPVERAAAPVDGSPVVPEPAYLMAAEPAFEKRQGVGGGAQAATTAVTQPATITTQWLPVNSKIGGVETETWLEFIYTQTFAKVPDQLPSAGNGVIGYGTLTKSKGKRSEPTPAPDAKATGVAGRVRI